MPKKSPDKILFTHALPGLLLTSRLLHFWSKLIMRDSDRFKHQPTLLSPTVSWFKLVQARKKIVSGISPVSCSAPSYEIKFYRGIGAFGRVIDIKGTSMLQRWPVFCISFSPHHVALRRRSATSRVIKPHESPAR